MPASRRFLSFFLQSTILRIYECVTSVEYMLRKIIIDFASRSAHYMLYIPYMPSAHLFYITSADIHSKVSKITSRALPK